MAHNVSKRDASFVQSNKGAAIGPFLYLGAKHMVTGYDHIFFLVGVIFFLYRLKDIVQYVSLFTLGHSTTLLLGVSWTANRKVQYELHGEPDVKPAGAAEDYLESYEKDDAEGKTESHGTFSAPSTRIQGWFLG